jgi:hypothetical protein
MREKMAPKFSEPFFFDVVPAQAETDVERANLRTGRHRPTTRHP